MTERCVNCSQKARGRYSPLGQPVCERHYTETLGMVIGGTAAGVPGAVTGPGILRWISRELDPRRRRTQRPSPEEPEGPDAT